MKKGTKILIGGLILVGVISAVGGNGENKTIDSILLKSNLCFNLYSTTSLASYLLSVLI